MDATRADVCAAAIADAFRDDGEIFASPMGLLPMLGARLARLTSNPDLVHLRRRVAVPARRPAAVREGRRGRGLDPVPPGLRRGRLRQAARDDGRHPDRPARQPEHLRDRRLRPAEAAAARLPRRPGQHGQQPDVATGCPGTPRASSSSRSTSSPASARSGPGRPARRRPASTTSTGSSATSASSTSADPTTRCACSRVHPGVTVDEVREASGCEIHVDRRRRPRRRDADDGGADPDPRGARPEGPARSRKCPDA